MSEALAEIKSEPTIQETEGGNITVIARYPHQMEKCQKSLIEWCDRKITQTQAEADDLLENLQIAKKNNWGASAFARHSKKAIERCEFYRKIKLALEAGHCIVPNFPVDIIAVRVGKDKPKYETSWSQDTARTAEAEHLPAGEGRYVDDENEIKTMKETKTDSQGKERTDYFYAPIAFDETCDFPFTTAKPEILEATARAMMDKVFDEIGVLPGAKKRKADPIIIGRIIDPRSTKYDKKFVSFLIAWFVDTSVL